MTLLLINFAVNTIILTIVAIGASGEQRDLLREPSILLIFLAVGWAIAIAVGIGRVIEALNKWWNA